MNLAIVGISGLARAVVELHRTHRASVALVVGNPEPKPIDTLPLEQICVRDLSSCCNTTSNATVCIPRAQRRGPGKFQHGWLKDS